MKAKYMFVTALISAALLTMLVCSVFDGNSPMQYQGSFAADLTIAERRSTPGGRWIEARSLQAGDVLRGFYGRHYKVDRVVSSYQHSTVYNLKVAELHTYAVGKEGILVHNKGEKEEAGPPSEPEIAVQPLQEQTLIVPPQDAVRIEEFINYFDYDYQEPEDPRPFAFDFELSGCPWAEEHLLLHIGLQGRKIAYSDLPPTTSPCSLPKALWAWIGNGIGRSSWDWSKRHSGWISNKRSQSSGPLQVFGFRSLGDEKILLPAPTA